MNLKIETLKRLMNCFQGSYINHNFEFICCSEINSYFMLGDVESELELKCKILEWLSRPAFKGEGCKNKKKRNGICDFHLKGINWFLGTHFLNTDFENIYASLGNGVDRTRTIKFIESGYNMERLGR